MSEPNEPSKPDFSQPPSSPWQGSQNPFSDIPPTAEKPYPVNSPYQPMIPPPNWRGDTINGLAIAGLVFSILGAVMGICLCGVPGIIGVALAIPAYFMAQHDLSLYSQGLHPALLSKLTTAKNMALAAIVVGVIGFVLGFVCVGFQIGIPFLEGALEEMN
jgi:hypothetical protein